ncbi:DUF5406 family protein [Paenibacillus bovis]|uniref:Uncharacterized protein n=1 Tax=Paenibacillus bovis TaxID=1616788 RepID=A0A1X9T415_9BACL|nr:DUF5406 family protein [Paenibacillus bovis]ARR10673.1 hypothetical protein AR543_p0065 [Paenibacillus bovis]
MNIYLPELNTTHLVQIVLQDADYRNEYRIAIDGNCKGAEILTGAIDVITDGTMTKTDWLMSESYIADEHGYVTHFVLYNGAGEQLLYDASDPDLPRIIVAAVIVQAAPEGSLRPNA